ncbi:MAG: winged helix-turn-helix domain-containing protein [Clostridia bacterium]|nr:winged helix-turn-helix domain-containing protein [Clostridia bacterium]
MRTPEDAFRQPLLEALVELGGSANIGDILKIVYEKLKNRLNKYDYQRLNSPPHETRWRNTTKWCRNTLVKEGLLSSTSPWGIWEITEEAGRSITGGGAQRHMMQTEFLAFYSTQPKHIPSSRIWNHKY